MKGSALDLTASDIMSKLSMQVLLDINTLHDVAVSVCCKLVSLQWRSETTRLMHFYLLVNWKITVGWWCSVCGHRCCSWNEGHYWHFLLAMSLECLANLMTGSSHCFWNFDGNSGCRFCVMVCLKLWADSSILIYIPPFGVDEVSR